MKVLALQRYNKTFYGNNINNEIMLYANNIIYNIVFYVNNVIREKHLFIKNQNHNVIHCRSSDFTFVSNFNHYKMLNKRIIKKKQEILDKALQIIKSEFFGIDEIIDRIFEAYSNWFLFHEFQETPTVINLWGMTGVGKTSLVRRLIDLTNMQKSLIYFQNKEKFSLNTFDLLDENQWVKKEKKANIFLFDEFQKWRTIDENSNEIEKGDEPQFWDLIDTGITYNSFKSHRVTSIQILLFELEYLVKKGVRVKNGMVYENKEIFLEKMEYIYRIGDDLRFVPSSDIYDLYVIYNDVINNPLLIYEKLLTMDENETVVFIKKILTHANKPKKVDMKNSLVFIVGNIDEAYHINNDFNPDMNADEYFEFTKKITVYNIKKALTKRFRSEQIARMGNLIINYPSLNANAYKSIISKELNEISSRIFKKFGIRMEYTGSFKDLIYAEGVFPTQGARPVISTINLLAKSNLNAIIMEMLKLDKKVDNIIVDFHNKSLIVKYLSASEIIKTTKNALNLQVEKQRISKQDDLQSIIAVHESGHAVLAGILLRSLPNFILSQTAANDILGMTNYPKTTPYVSKDIFMKQAAVFLGGYMAEKLVFGEDKVTSGSESDIQSATNYVANLLKNSGFGELPILYNVEDFRMNDNYFDRDGAINENIRQIIEMAMVLAEKTLKENMPLLLKLADRLSDTNRLDKEVVREIFSENLPDYNENFFIEDASKIYYRDKLKEQVRKLQSADISENSLHAMPIILNKDTNHKNQ